MGSKRTLTIINYVPVGVSGRSTCTDALHVHYPSHLSCVHALHYPPDMVAGVYGLWFIGGRWYVRTIHTHYVLC
jgi:hypothetical protein